MTAVAVNPFAEFFVNPIQKRDEARATFSGEVCCTIDELSGEKSTGKGFQVVWVPPIVHKGSADTTVYSDTRGLFEALFHFSVVIANKTTLPLDVLGYVPLALLSDKAHTYKIHSKFWKKILPAGSTKTVQKSRRRRRGKGKKKAKMVNQSLSVAKMHVAMSEIFSIDFNRYTLREVEVESTTSSTRRVGFVLFEGLIRIPDYNQYSNTAVERAMDFVDVDVKVNYSVSCDSGLAGTVAQKVDGLVVSTMAVSDLFDITPEVDRAVKSLAYRNRAPRSTRDNFELFQLPFENNTSLGIRHLNGRYQLVYEPHSHKTPVSILTYQSEDYRVVVPGLGIVNNDSAEKLNLCNFKWDERDNAWYIWDDAGDKWVDSANALVEHGMTAAALCIAINTRAPIKSRGIRSVKADSIVQKINLITHSLGEIIEVGGLVASLF